MPLLRALAALPLVSTLALAQSTAAPAPAQAPVGLTWKDIVNDPSHIKFYGMLRLDVQYDDSRMNSAKTPGWVLSEDPTAPPNGIGAGGKNKEDLGLNPRLTRFGVDVDAGKLDSMADAHVSGKIEIDFYNTSLAPQSDSRAALRMRHAYLKLAWSEWSLLFGQTVDVISPLMPIVNNDQVMWDAGNLGDRRPQIRAEWARASGESKFIVQTEAGLTSAIDNQDLDPAGTYGTGYSDGEASGLPTLQARVAYAFPLAGQKAEVGIYGHQAWEDPDGTFGGESRFESKAYGLDISLPLYKDRLSLKSELFQGENLDDVRGGIRQGINATTGEEIESKGGWAELGFKTSATNSLHAGYATDDPEDSDLNAGGRAENEVWYLASRWNFKPVTIGLEYLNWTTDYVGFDEGTNNRFVAFIAYNF